MLLGAGLARRLGVTAGSRVVLETASPALSAGVASPARTALTVAAVVETGFSEVDDTWSVLALSRLRPHRSPGCARGRPRGEAERSSGSTETVASARALLGPGATVLDWKVLNRDLFQALAVQQTLLFVVLTLIVAVAAGTVVSSLVVLLAEKTRDVGVLSALGAPPRVIARTFRLSGLILGGGGLVLGVLFGLLVCAFLTTFHIVRFRPRSRRCTTSRGCRSVPSRCTSSGSSASGSSSCSSRPRSRARRAERMNASEALRYE